MSSPPPHTGILRDETLALRHILGYWDGTSASSEFSATQLGTKLPESLITDILFVSVDLDTFQGYEKIRDDQQLHIGISTFDTRHLQEMIAHPALLDQHQHAIDSYQFVVGNRLYARRARRRFLFGKSEDINLSDLKSKFELITQDRDYVLVFHGANEDMKILQQLDIGNQACYVLDTVKAAQFPLQLYYRYSLEKLLDSLNISFANLHAAGNDAHFALKALLMIAVKDAQTQPGDTNTSLLHALEAISRAPRPILRKELPHAIEGTAEQATTEPKPPKLGINAKRRARAERKRLLRESQLSI
ncbi:hypothetical protein TOPH_08280 [Tolypocladium ophioglossoides CBS 100239]|uniref:Gfd2/YDR514C-like C-terminal domain-containing protein n=1 Tax=Tolypocladium ophioglossoides (strain CBS 100239) TaxID=1163406 RepID=A0A0L0MZ83_TOLOC|nr:hypothetical protein TOPH_08280 [Tolypocladium ophioglossoides CBS 100239]